MSFSHGCVVYTMWQHDTPEKINQHCSDNEIVIYCSAVEMAPLGWSNYDQASSLLCSTICSVFITGYTSCRYHYLHGNQYTISVASVGYMYVERAK